MPAPPRRSATTRDARTFYRLATIALVVAVLYFAQVILVPLSLAVLLAFALTPPAAWLERRGLGRVPSSLLMTVLALGAIGGIGWVAVYQGEQLAAKLPEHEEEIRRKFDPVIAFIKRLERLEDATAPDREQKPANATAKPSDPPTPVVVKSSGSVVLAFLPTLAQPVAKITVETLLVTVLSIFLLVQRESARDRLIGLAGRRGVTSAVHALDDASGRVSKFLLLQSGTNAAMGLIVAGGLSLIEVPFAPLWGMLTACLRFVPYVGIWLSALFPFALAVAVLPGWWPALLVLALYAGFDLVMTNVVEPLLFGHGTGVSSLALVLAAVFWAWLWGPVGLLLAIPLTVCMVVLGEHVPSLGFLRTLLADAPEVDPSDRFYHRALARDVDAAALVIEELGADRPLLDLYDEVILPALAHAKAEHDAGSLSPVEERQVYRTAHAILGGPLAGRRAATGAGDEPDRPAAKVVGCSTKGIADRLALGMLRDVARPAGCEVEIVPAARLVEAVAEASRENAEIVACIAAVSPGGLAQAAGLCRDVRRRCPGVRVFVGRWGVTDDKPGAEKYLKAAGAERLTWTLRETLAQIAPEWAERPAGAPA